MCNRTTAGILALLLGGIGVHKFYMGQIGMGIIYFLFCWTFIPLIIGFIEGIIYLCMTDEEFDEKYNLEFIKDELQQQKLLKDNEENSKSSLSGKDLAALYDLKQKGGITDREYEKKKAEIMGTGDD